MTNTYTPPTQLGFSKKNRMFSIRKIRFVFSTMLVLTCCIAGYSQDFDKAKLDQFFDRLSEKKKAMGSILIAKDGKPLYSRAIGYSQVSKTNPKPLTPGTRYRVGSITKMFTAVLIFQLVEEGKIKLDDHLYKFFPQVKSAEKITIAHLLGHRAGIHELTGDPDFKKRRFEVVPKEDVIALIAKNPLDFEPGTKYAYSNAGYFLLGAIIEKVAGSTYPELLNQKINSKIGLKDTYPGSGKIDVTNNESFSYRLLREWELQPETNMSLLFGSGSLISTTADMATFIRELFNDKLVAKESLDQMIRRNLGIDTFTYNGKRAYGHTGGIDGFGAWLAYLPDEKLAVSYGTNGKVYPVAKLIEDVLTIYYNKAFTLPSFEGINISTELLDKYVGVYSSPDVPRKFKITREANILYVKPGDESAVPLEATAEDQFRIESVGIVLRFDAAKKQLFLIRRNGPERVLTKEE